jgi:hypothetical protein
MDPILVNLSAYGGKYRQELIGQIFKNLEDANITVLEDIKGTTKFVRLRVAKGLKPYTGQFAGGDKLNYSDRAVSPEQFQYDLHIDPKKYHNTFATETQDKHSKYFGLPEENYIWQKVTEEIADEIIESTIYKGVKGGNDSDPAKNICNGFEKRILDMITAGKATVATGVITSANAVTKFEKFYTDAMTVSPNYRRMKMILYCSHNSMDKYVDHYRELFDKDPENWSDDAKPVYLKKTKGKVQIIAVDWLGDSDRLILAPKINMILATDKLSDINVMNIVPDVYGLKVGITGTIDLQIIDEEAVWFNEAA